MRTWWIMRDPYDSSLRVEHAHEGTYLLKVFEVAGIGPFWSHDEAQRVMEHWTKQMEVTMYRIYYLNSLDEWILYAREGNEDTAYNTWNECCDRYPHHQVKLTKETIMKEA